MNTRKSIELACDHHEGAEFCEWINRHTEHKAFVGNTTQTFVDDWELRVNQSAADLVSELWEEYCEGLS